MTNRFTGLDLIDRVPDELWTEVCDIHKKLGSRPTPRERNAKSKMAVWGDLTNNCEKKRSEKQREKERYNPLNAEFQRIVRRNNKASLSDQCKEIEENKTRDLFKKIRDTKRTFHAKMSSIKERNGMDLTEEEDIKKKWQEYTFTKKIFMTQITTLPFCIFSSGWSWSLSPVQCHKLLPIVL